VRSTSPPGPGLAGRPNIPLNRGGSDFLLYALRQGPHWPSGRAKHGRPIRSSVEPQSVKYRNGFGRGIPPRHHGRPLPCSLRVHLQGYRISPIALSASHAAAEAVNVVSAAPEEPAADFAGLEPSAPVPCFRETCRISTNGKTWVRCRPRPMATLKSLWRQAASHRDPDGAENRQRQDFPAFQLSSIGTRTGGSETHPLFSWTLTTPWPANAGRFQSATARTATTKFTRGINVQPFFAGI